MAKRSENHADDEDVIEGQCLFDGKGGEVRDAALCAQRVPDPPAEHQRHADIEQAELEAGADADFLRMLRAVCHCFFLTAFAQHPEVEGQKRDHQRHKDQPHPGGLAEPQLIQEFHQRYSFGGAPHGVAGRGADTNVGQTSTDKSPCGDPVRVWPLLRVTEQLYCS